MLSGQDSSCIGLPEKLDNVDFASLFVRLTKLGSNTTIIQLNFKLNFALKLLHSSAILFQTLTAVGIKTLHMK